MKFGIALACLALGAGLVGCSSMHAAPGTAAAETPSTPPPEVASTPRIQPDDFTYLGAFRLPQGGERPATFAYGGAAMTFNPAGDPHGPPDGSPGSLFITGHDRLPYGELPDGDQVAEVSIPAPVSSRSLSDLGQAEFLQPFSEVTDGRFEGLEEIPRVGLLYLNAPGTGAQVHITFGQHFTPDPPVASHAWFDPDLTTPTIEGPWFLGDLSFYAISGYLLEIPQEWADVYALGRVIGTGRFRDGGWSGMGPTLYAYRPWSDTGAPAERGSQLEATTLLHYQASDTTTEIVHSLVGYQHPDEWEGAAWLTTDAGASAVLFAGTKATGDRYWYGYLDPADPGNPCVDAALIGQFPVCRAADGSECPTQEQVECAAHTDYRGWWSSRFDAQFLLYDPADLGRVAMGELQSWEPQPYATLDIDEHLYLNPDRVEEQMLGTGDQRRYRVGEVGYDRQNGLLYVLELFADGAQPVVHVWRVR